LAVVPLLIVIAAFGAESSKDLAITLGFAAVKIVIALALLLVIGQRFMTRWLNVVARRRSQELFVLNLLLITLGAAFITDRFGLSLALGAFIAGMLISETPFRHQVEEDIKPFRDVLLGLFFVTTGMLLDARVIWEHPLLVLGFFVVKYEAYYAYVTFAALVTYIVFTVKVTNWRTHFRRTMNELDSRANSRAIDSLINYETVKYFGNEEWEAQRYDENLKRYRKAAIRSQNSLSVLNFGQQAIIGTGLVFI
ncbi:cation:proton antiporter, partial [Paraburkholderia sp. SIMBA_049]